ncbi:MAG: aminotransferase class I/II-fold pyridoxal phosphate-dependent enzyme [Lachnospiraceae bacterium]|nr:aminotransferase class I/II-fold pyridoxal phosphate-dependent enzyme [Lachnospiraceae bacterium]
MLKHKDHFHGSDLEKIEQIYGIKKEEITSFSANVNPLGLSHVLREDLASHLDVICSYPDREYTSLRTVIAKYCDTVPESILVGNGSTELITLFIKMVAPQKAMIVGPTYSEYERELSLGGGTSLYFPLKEEDDFVLDPDSLIGSLNESIDMLIMCNPNNPTSSAVSRSSMRRILDACKTFDIFVMIDETYVEFAEDYNRINSVPLTVSYNNLCILRGVSKFFAAPGLRLGYAICGDPDLMKDISAIKDPWTVSSLAEAAGRLMFSDEEYIRSTKELIFSERRRVCDMLRNISEIKVYEPCANFVLSRITKENVDADILFDNAIRQKMMIRNCSSFPFLDNSYFRICFMNPEDNDRLLAVIADTMK